MLPDDIKYCDLARAWHLNASFLSFLLFLPVSLQSPFRPSPPSPHLRLLLLFLLLLFPLYSWHPFALLPTSPSPQSSHPLFICLSLSFSLPSICLEVLLRDNSSRSAVKDREDVRAAWPAREKSFEICEQVFSFLFFSFLLFSSLPSSSHPSYLVDKSELSEYAKYAASWACLQNHMSCLCPGLDVKQCWLVVQCYTFTIWIEKKCGKMMMTLTTVFQSLRMSYFVWPTNSKHLQFTMIERREA